jgi:hypothetical protein
MANVQAEAGNREGAGNDVMVQEDVARRDDVVRVQAAS